MYLEDKKELLEDDFKYIWHPFTQMKDFEKKKPIIIEKGKGVYIYDIDGNRYIDSVSSWWTNTLGHSNPRLNRALMEQARKIEHVIFAGFTHRNAIKLSKRLVEITCDNLTKVFFSDNGSTAVEVALKMAYQYWAQKGQKQRSKFIALENSYHGDTLGAVSVGGVDLYHKLYKPLLFDIYKAKSPYCYRCPCGKEKNKCKFECVGSIEQILIENKDEIAAVIVEPMIQAAGGMIIYDKQYLQKVRKLCDKYDVLLIDDEVAMGFGRTGKMFAYEHANIKPDIICLAKGITAGYMPLSVTMTTDEIYNAFYDDYENCKTFFHGHSYTANPLACAIAVENLKIHKEQNIVDIINENSKVLAFELEKLRTLKHVGDIRYLGLIGAIELVEDKKTKQRYPFRQRKGQQIYEKALEYGVILRPLGDIIYFMPPFVITKNQIKKMVNAAKKAIQFVCK